MTAHAYFTTFANLAKVLSGNPEPRIGDVCAWRQRQPDNPYPHFAWALQSFVRADAMTSVREAKEWLLKRLKLEESKRDGTFDLCRGGEPHWSYSPNDVFSLRSLLALIERFEADEVGR